MIGGSRAPYPLVGRPLAGRPLAGQPLVRQPLLAAGALLGARLCLVVVGVAVIGVVVLRPLRRVEVGGDSMLPTLQPGDRLLVLRGPKVRPGDLVTVPDPRDASRTLVKRVASVSGHGVVVVGDNSAQSTDSRAFGTVPAASVQGRVVYRYHPDHRRGRAGVFDR